MLENYKEIKKRVIEVLHTKTEIENRESIPQDNGIFSYNNGIKTYVGALFIDIIDSTKLFKEVEKELLARILRTFFREIIIILKSNSNYRQIGIRGDCVYAIYSAPTEEELSDILINAIEINTFQKMFQKILQQNQFINFKIGIGLGASETLIIRSGKKKGEINDNIWIGDAVIDASKLSSEAGRNNLDVIAIDSNFYKKIKYLKCNENEQYQNYFKEEYSPKLAETIYTCDMIICDFNEWIENGMK